jgi:hypothetical protein
MKYIEGAIFLSILGALSSFGYTKTGNDVYKSNGSQADVQATIEAAKPWSTVIIANGSYTWSTPMTITRPVRLQGESKGGVIITNDLVGKDLVTVAVPAGISGEISNLNFIQGGGRGSGRHMAVYTPTLLHDCYFETSGSVWRCIEWATNGGVIWNCSFYSHDQDKSGIAFANSSGSSQGVSADWTRPDTMGTADTKGTANTYLEDCTFTNLYLQAIDFADNARTVVRHCTFNNSAITSHGLDTGLYGARQWEVYDNQFIFTTSGKTPAGGEYPLPLNYFFYVRGGTGVIADNVIPEIKSQQWGEKAGILMTVFNIRRRSAYIPCQTKWPALHQVGQGYSNRLIVDPVYIWGNTGGGNYDNPGINDWQPDDCGQGQLSADYIKAGRDYVTGSAKPNYTKFQYPHPLRGTFSSSLIRRSLDPSVSRTRLRKYPTARQSATSH